MKRTLSFCLLATSIGSASAFEGADSLPSLRSGKVLEEGFTWYAPVFRNQYEAFGTVLDFEPGFRTAAADGLEVGFSAPYRQDRDAEAEGLRFLRAMAKYQLYAEGAQYGALTLFGTFDSADEQKGIGSGSSNFGAEFNFSDYGANGGLALHTLLGLERTDNRVLRDDGASEYQLVSKLRFGLGVEQRIWRNGSFLLQGLVSMGFGETAQRQYGVQLMPGFRFGSSKGGFALTLAAGYDIPQRGEAPEQQYLLALSYSPRAPDLTLQRLAERVEMLERRVGSLEERLAAHDEQSEARFGAVEGQLDGLATTTALNTETIAALKTKTGLLAVEVLNASGQPGLEEVFAQELRAKGYHVVRTGVAPDGVREASLINYRDGYAKQAVAMGHGLRKWQVVARGSDLPPDVELRLTVGSDLK